MKRLSLAGLAGCSALALYVTAGVQFPLLVALALGLCGLFGGRLVIPMKVVGVLALLSMVGTVLYQPTMPRAHGFLLFPSFTYSAGLFSCFGTAVFLLRREEGWRKHLVLVTSIITLMAAGNTTYALPYGYVVLAFTLFLMLYVRDRQQPVRVGMAASVLLTLALGVGFAALLSRSQPAFRNIVGNFQLWSTSINFGDTAGIKPQGGPGGTKVLLRLFAEDTEHYLAARRYIEYRNRKWSAAEGGAIGRTPTTVFPESGAFALRGEPDNGWEPQGLDSVELTTLAPEALLLPLKTRLVEASLDSVQVSDCGDLLVERAGAGFSGTYRLARGELPVEEAPELLRRCLVSDVDPFVSELAKEIAGDQSDKLKIFSLVQFFHENFEYGFGYPFDKKEDPVVAFLKERPAAHCEVYATCLTLMARSAGVPARYVQGFMVRERNEWGGYWVSRERDAHAWTEVYLEGMGWVTVDATPPGVSAPLEPDSSWSELVDVVKRFFQRCWAHIARGPQALFGDLVEAVKAYPVSSGILLLGVVLWSLRGRIRSLLPTRVEPEAADVVHPRVLEMQELFSEYERRTGSEKPGGLTLLEWANSAPEGGEFLREYSRIRYSQTLPSGEDLVALKALLPAVAKAESP